MFRLLKAIFRRNIQEYIKYSTIKLTISRPSQLFWDVIERS